MKIVEQGNRKDNLAISVKSNISNALTCPKS